MKLLKPLHRHSLHNHQTLKYFLRMQEKKSAIKQIICFQNWVFYKYIVFGPQMCCMYNLWIFHNMLNLLTLSSKDDRQSVQKQPESKWRFPLENLGVLPPTTCMKNSATAPCKFYIFCTLYCTSQCLKALTDTEY